MRDLLSGDRFEILPQPHKEFLENGLPTDGGSSAGRARRVGKRQDIVLQRGILSYGAHVAGFPPGLSSRGVFKCGQGRTANLSSGSRTGEPSCASLLARRNGILAFE